MATEKGIGTIKPRRLARAMARAQLKKRGSTGYNKTTTINGRKTRSRFARLWKGLAYEAMKDAQAREAARKKKK